MADRDKRTHPRTPVALRIKLRYRTVESFVSKFATNISRGGMFISSRNPKPPGTELRFELRLADDSSLISGRGVVRWIREYDAGNPKSPHGMGVEFTSLTKESALLVEQIITHRTRLGMADIPNLGPGTSDRPEPPASPAEASSAPPPAPKSEPSKVHLSAAPTAAAAPPPSVTAAEADLPELDDHSMERALRRARELAGGASSQDDQLAELVRVSAAPIATSVDDASAGLARLLGGRAVSGRRARPVPRETPPIAEVEPPELAEPGADDQGPLPTLDLDDNLIATEPALPEEPMAELVEPAVHAKPATEIVEPPVHDVPTRVGRELSGPIDVSELIDPDLVTASGPAHDHPDFGPDGLADDDARLDDILGALADEDSEPSASLASPSQARLEEPLDEALDGLMAESFDDSDIRDYGVSPTSGAPAEHEADDDDFEIELTMGSVEVVSEADAEADDLGDEVDRSIDAVLDQIDVDTTPPAEDRPNLGAEALDADGLFAQGFEELSNPGAMGQAPQLSDFVDVPEEDMVGGDDVEVSLDDAELGLLDDDATAVGDSPVPDGDLGTLDPDAEAEQEKGKKGLLGRFFRKS